MTRYHLLTLTAALLISSSAAFAETASSLQPEAVRENEATMAALFQPEPGAKSENSTKPAADPKPISVWGAKLDLSPRDGAQDHANSPGCWGIHGAQ